MPVALVASPPNFAAPLLEPVGSSPQGLAIGDVNGDGRPDVATADLGADSVTLLVSSGGRQLVPAPGSPIAVGPYPAAVALADINRDGSLDLISANSAGSSVSVGFGDGTGAMQRVGATPVGITPIALAVGDLNGDGLPEIVTANQGSDDSTILYGGGGNATVKLGASPRALRLVDVNGDRNLDMIAANSASDSVSVLLGDGKGGLAPALGSPILTGPGTGPRALLAEDLNGDGRLDIAVANAITGTLVWYFGSGTGSFAVSPGAPIALGPGTASLAAGDLNGDGRADLAIVSAAANEVQVLTGNGTGAFTRSPTSPFALGPGANAQGIAIGDLNDDSRPDVAVASFGLNALQVLPNATLGLPGVRTGDAIPTQVGAVVSGAVDPANQATTYRVEWGLTTAYGNQSVAANAINGPQAQAVTVQLLGLTPGGTFHYRLVAQNASGTVTGSDRVLVAGVTPPTIAGGDRTPPTAQLLQPACRAPARATGKASKARTCANYRRTGAAWLTLRGTASDPSGIAGVQVSVVRRDSRGRCGAYTGRTWVDARCSSRPTIFIAARLTGAGRWSFKLSQVPRGPHVFAIRAIDRAGNVQTSLTVRRLLLPR